MSNTIRSYRGLEIYPLVYPHQPSGLDGVRHYESGFDASVRICRRGADDARLAGASYAEQVIDGMVAGQSIAGL
jgi:hypothetical protein